MPVIQPKIEAVSWDDEEEFEPAPVLNHGDAPKLSKEKEQKKAREAEAAKQAALEAALEANGETEGERRLRERRQVEEADHELADELFAGKGDMPQVYLNLSLYILTQLLNSLSK